MSDSWINLIPSDPYFVPALEAQQKALELMRCLVGKADEVSVQVSDAVRLVDCGENLISIRCPQCGENISIDWWQDQVEYQFANGYSIDPVTVPCCKKLLSPTVLKFDWPQGFARFSLEAMNPDVPDFSDSDVGLFEKILGCRLIKVLQHI